VNAWLKFPNIEPRKLIPAMMQYDRHRGAIDRPNHAVRYLQQCVTALRSQDPAIHNYLLVLYAKQPEEEPLIQFLDKSDHVDLKYALRLCLREQQRQACIRIYSAMGLYEEAVENALLWGDVELAKVNADKPSDEALQKNLWLMVAKHVFANAAATREGIKRAIRDVRQCQLLKIEDILPFFPEDTLIDDFREEICDALQDYNQTIENLKQDMDLLTTSTGQIQQEIKELPNRYGFVYGDQKCMHCNRLVIGEEFYLFPCGHAFRADCLSEVITPYLSGADRQKISYLKTKIAAARESTIREELQEELDNLIAAECPLCGDLMINLVGEPFDLQASQNESEWEI